MQTRLIKNAQRKQTVFLHRGIYRWTNFLTLDIRPHTNISFPKISLLFLLYFLILLFFFFFFYKKNSFFQTNHSIILDQTLILPIFIFFFFQNPYFLKFLTIYLTYRFVSKTFFLFSTLSFFNDLDIPSWKRFSMNLNLDTISSSIFSPRIEV